MQAGNDARMHLAHTTLTQVQRRADLLHRHLLVVVEDDDEPFVAVEAAGDQSHQVAVLEAIGGILGLLVLQNVDLSHVLVAICFVPFLVQADEIDGGCFAEVDVEFFDWDAEFGGEFVGAGRAAQRLRQAVQRIQGNRSPGPAPGSANNTDVPRDGGRRDW